MNSEIWEINGCELNLDIEDADVMERYENAFEAMSAEENEIPKDGKQSEKIFSDCPVNTSVYDDVYFEFLNFVRNQTVDSAKQRVEKLSKYRPEHKNRHVPEK